MPAESNRFYATLTLAWLVATSTSCTRGEPCTTQVASAQAVASSQPKPEKKAPKMEREYQFIQDINQQLRGDGGKPGELAKRETAEARLVPRAAARLWTSAEPPLASEAFDFLVDIEDLAIVPVLDGPLRDDAQTQSQAIELLTTQELKLRERILQRLQLWLEDKRVVPNKPQFGHSEEKPAERRVCDDAYLALRRLVHFGEDELAQLVDARTFLGMTDAQRDAVIAKARATKTWRRIQDPDGVTYDPPPSTPPGMRRRE
ncbi:MAG: hypothetical protein QM784_20330 [Polyangiaceae bacterium]